MRDAPLFEVHPPTEESRMLRGAVIFLVLAIIAAIFGFAGIASTAATIAKVLFVIFLVLALVSFLLGRRTTEV